MQVENDEKKLKVLPNRDERRFVPQRLLPLKQTIDNDFGNLSNALGNIGGDLSFNQPLAMIIIMIHKLNQALVFV